jgi:hypothetical protein
MPNRCRGLKDEDLSIVLLEDEVMANRCLHEKTLLQGRIPEIAMSENWHIECAPVQSGTAPAR